MKRYFPWLIPAVIVLATVSGVLHLLRSLAPQLIGLPLDLELVQSTKKLPPFYEGVFRNQAVARDQYLLNDPHTVVRARPFVPNDLAWGPNDLLGFRNREVPLRADVITIGDSQTYGNNVLMHHNWPAYAERLTGREDVQFYSMATGGWGAAQYWAMFGYAIAFEPTVIVVAFYSGNDPLDSARTVAANSFFKDLLPTGIDIPVQFPTVNEAIRADKWSVQVTPDFTTVMTPGIRLLNQIDHPAVNFGYEVMYRSARKMSELAEKRGIRLITTIVPTKELVYSKQLENLGVSLSESYSQLVRLESQRIADLSDRLDEISIYVDVVNPLQQAAAGEPLYPSVSNGHPVEAGYRVLGEVLGRAIDSLLPDAVEGPVLFKLDDRLQILALVKQGTAWPIKQGSPIAKQLHVSQLPVLTSRDMFRFNWQPGINELPAD